MWLRGVFFLYFDCIARHLKREEKDRQETKLRDKIDRSSWQMTEWLVGDVIPLFHIFSKLFHERFLIGISSNSISPQSIISHNRNRRSSSRSHARTPAIGIILMLIEIEYVCLFNSDTCDVCATARAFAFCIGGANANRFFILSSHTFYILLFYDVFENRKYTATATVHVMWCVWMLSNRARCRLIHGEINKNVLQIDLFSRKNNNSFLFFSLALARALPAWIQNSSIVQQLAFYWRIDFKDHFWRNTHNSMKWCVSFEYWHSIFHARVQHKQNEQFNKMRSTKNHVCMKMAFHLDWIAVEFEIKCRALAPNKGQIEFNVF